MPAKSSKAVKPRVTNKTRSVPVARPGLVAKGDNQQAYIDYLQRHPMVYGIGPAGTGKTYLATVVGLDLLLSGAVEKMILTRATVPVSGEQLGFLPGGVKEKMDPWVAEMNDIARERVGDEMLRSLYADGRLQVIPFAHMRGRSFSKAYILCDEMQNTTPAQAKMLVTRIGEGSRMVLNGDLGQSDLPGRNGLQDLLDLIEEQNLMMPVVRFKTEDIRRSHLCQLWVEAYARRDQK